MRFDSYQYCLLPLTAIFPVIAMSFLLATSTWGQEAVGTMSTSQQAPGPTTESNAAPLNPASDSTVQGSTDLRNEVSAEERRFQYTLKLTLRGVYDDNINISSTNPVSDYYLSIEPVISLGAGDITVQENNFLRLDYAPSLFLFYHHSSHDAVQHVIRLGGQYNLSRLTMSLAEEVAILDGTDLRNFSDQTNPGSRANLDVGGRTKFQTYASKLGANYDVSAKTFLSTDFNSLITDYNSSRLFSSQIVSENFYVNYRYSDKVTVGLGGTGGYDFVDNPAPASSPAPTPTPPPSNSNQVFEQANARLSYQATGKLTFNLSGGIEFRQFENDSRGQYISPVFQLSAIYQPSDSTSITLNGSRQTFNSGSLAAQDFTATFIQGSLRQRFLQRFFFGIAGGYQNSDYFSTVNGLTASRRDDYYFVEPSLDFSVTRFWTIGGYYLRRQNDSSDPLFKFNDEQVGFRTSLTF
jgi:Putative beta-barrel porin 2